MTSAHPDPQTATAAAAASTDFLDDICQHEERAQRRREHAEQQARACRYVTREKIQAAEIESRNQSEAYRKESLQAAEEAGKREAAAIMQMVATDCERDRSRARERWAAARVHGLQLLQELVGQR